MGQVTSTGCGHCGKGVLIPVTSAKWGRCPFCMAVAAAGTVTGWSFTLSIWLGQRGNPIIIGSICLSACFTVVLLLHVIAYYRRQLFRS